ncbi:intraflagellar transport protein 27 homolog [Argiope bruennichi]|uniref:Intraflagellar transport protein 27 like protein n=1 Tax=Argiope bruennichi TaxID=94029 RepID=A0A8T0FVH6_ARGBR|nr:intraflagellar transport protein 27 homolog [Argiope bruennichi]KAF8794746.1 Intraflagellar transport protein 27 like protein [Argiope bruennichi]
MPNILRAKCIVVGDPAVGKSAIVHTFLHDSDKFQKNYIMTCAVEVKTKIIAIPDSVDAVELLIFDSAGKDAYLDFQTQLWHHPSMVCVVFDLTDENSFNNSSKWLDIVRNTGRYLTVPGVLIGSKSDLKERRVVKANVAQDYARKNSLQYFECSAKENKGVEEPFFYLANEWHKMYLEKVEYCKTIS